MDAKGGWLASAIKFFRELRRRHVFHIATVYVGTAWVVTRLASFVVPALLLPESFTRAVFALLILGFPIALVLAWALEIGPKGIRRTTAVESESEASTGASAAVALGRASAAAPLDQNSLAVLPFANLSADPDDEYLSDGLAEEVLDSVARSTSLRVVSRTSAFAFKGTATDVRAIGQQLGVGLVLEGSLRRRSDQLRVRVQLTDAQTGFQRWAATYQHTVDDLFTLQDMVAREVTSALLGQLEGPDVVIQTPDRPTQSNEAYKEYLRGRHAAYERTGASLERALRHFQEAARLDPGFAPAYGGQAEALTLLVEYGILPPSSADPRGPAERAVELDPESASAWMTLALARQLRWEWAGAETAFEHAVALDPADATTRHRRSLFLAYLGRAAQAEREIGKARKLDPGSPIIGTTAAWLDVYAGRPDRALLGLQDVVRQHPTFPVAYVAIAMAHTALGQHAEAAAATRRAIDLGSDTPTNLGLLAHSLGRAGDRDESKAIVGRLQAADGYVPSFYLAVAHLGLGDADEALRHLERAMSERSPHLVYLLVDPYVEPLRGDPRFDHIREAVGLQSERTNSSVPAIP